MTSLPGLEDYAPAELVRTAEISTCGRYRYVLTRRWSPACGTACWIMLNPSRADDRIDDPTLRRCIGFTQREGFGALTVVNLFAWRATDPKALRRTDERHVVGPDNDSVLAYQASIAELVIVAWGAYPWNRARRRAEDVLWLLRQLGVTAWRVGPPTKDGHPSHPLYLDGDLPLQRHW